jgi:hypothetical protein
MRRPGAAIVLTLLSQALGCSLSGPAFTVSYAPGFAKEGAKVAVFGVFRDGRMSPEAWDEFGPRLSAALHGNICDVAVGANLRARDPAVFAAVDDVARADGITDDLLDKFAPSAGGDAILVVTVAGRVSKPKESPGSAGAPMPALATGGRGGRGGGRSGGPHPAGGGHNHRAEVDVFEMTASVFSKREHKSVAMVSMAYTGPSESEAIAAFADKLGSALPGATCASWRTELRIDAATIQPVVAP